MVHKDCPGIQSLVGRIYKTQIIYIARYKAVFTSFFLYIRSSVNFDISQSHRDGVIVAQGFNPGFIKDCPAIQSPQIIYIAIYKVVLTRFLFPIYKECSEFRYSSVPSGRHYCSARFQPWVYRRLFSNPKSRRENL